MKTRPFGRSRSRGAPGRSPVRKAGPSPKGGFLSRFRRSKNVSRLYGDCYMCGGLLRYAGYESVGNEWCNTYICTDCHTIDNRCSPGWNGLMERMELERRDRAMEEARAESMPMVYFVRRKADGPALIPIAKFATEREAITFAKGYPEPCIVYYDDDYSMREVYA